MAESAVTDRPATDTDTEAVAAAVTEDTEATSAVTDGSTATVQTEDEPASEVTEADPHEVALAAAREAAIEEGREQARAELEAQRQRDRDNIRRSELKQHYPNTVRAMEADLVALGLTEPADRQRILNHMAGFNLKAQEAILAPFEDAVQELIPASARDDFNRAADGKSAADFQRTFAEYMAEHDPAIRAKVLKGIKLEDLEKTASFKAQLTARDAKQYDAGRAKGRTDPVGESHGEERVNSRAGYKTKAEARAMRVKGLIDNTELRTALANVNLPD